jgi:glycosyltransferase involved in cell wall biosynthesis
VNGAARPLVSVIIPTRNRRELLREVLDSLIGQTLAADRFEVIVVDNCSEDSTREMVAEYGERVKFRLRYHRMPSNQGAVRSRNTGASLASAPVYAFTDSDCRVSPAWLERGLAAIAGTNAGFVAGPTLNKPGQEVRFFTVGAVDVGGENPIYPTCNILYPASVFWQMGGFDEGVYIADAGGAPIECADADLAWRTKEAGYESVFAPDLVVYHEVRRATPWEWLAAHFRVMLIPELIRRHAGLRPRLLWWGPFCLADNVLFYVAVAGAVAGVWSAWLLALCLPFLCRVVRISSRNPSLAQLPKLPAQMFFLTLRQALICGSLIYGSFRFRSLVL